MKLKEKFSAKLKNQKGFTLIEMLLVVALIAILVAISIPMVMSSLEDARVATDDANLRAAKAAAAIDYLDDGELPANPCYYDAKNGKVVSTKDEAGKYGKSSAHKDEAVVINFNSATGEITCDWTTTPAGGGGK